MTFLSGCAGCGRRHDSHRTGDPFSGEGVSAIALIDDELSCAIVTIMTTLTRSTHGCVNGAEPSSATAWADRHDRPGSPGRDSAGTKRPASDLPIGELANCRARSHP